MERYKSFYPTLRQAKTKWSKPSIVAKQGEGPSHDWYEMMKKDARAKLASSIHQSKWGSISHQTKIVHEENAQAIPDQPLDANVVYHVTHTKHVAKIKKHGILPMKTSNWVKAGNKERYGGGEVYAFTHKDDAHAWAGRMDWAHNQTLGSGKISIVTAHRPKNREFHVDDNDPLSQAGKKGLWLKTQGGIEPHHIIRVEPYHPKKLGEDKVSVFGFETQLQNVRRKETGVKRKKKMKDPRPTDFSRPDLKEAKDRIGTHTPSAESIAKKHNKDVAEIQAQIDKGIKVEREHTDSDAEAHEIARDHLDEFPDYYDRLDKMEKKAKKDMKEETYNKVKSRRWRGRLGKLDSSQLKPMVKMTKGELGKTREVSKLHSELLKKQGWKVVKEGYDPEKELLKDRIESHKEVAKKMAAKHGDQSQEAAFHRALVKRMEKELGEDSKPVNEAAKAKKQSKKSWQADARLALRNKSSKEIRKSLRTHAKRVNEDVPNSVGGGMSPVIGGEGNIHGIDPIMGKPIRRRKFAGKQVFVVDPTTYHRAYLGKRKYEHYEKYLEGSPFAEEIRAYGRKYWDEPIILENEQTGAMVYLKYGSK